MDRDLVHALTTSGSDIRPIIIYDDLTWTSGQKLQKRALDGLSVKLPNKTWP